MKQISFQSKTFIILFVILLGGTFLVLITASNTETANNKSSLAPTNYQIINYPARQAAGSSTPIDTSTWKTYIDSKYNFSFKYPEDWKITPTTKYGFHILVIDPGRKYYNIEVAVSPESFYGLDGIPTKEEVIAGATAYNAQDMLIGIKKDNYYTFDLGGSLSLKPKFMSLVKSLAFEQ